MLVPSLFSSLHPRTPHFPPVVSFPTFSNLCLLDSSFLLLLHFYLLFSFLLLFILYFFSSFYSNSFPSSSLFPPQSFLNLSPSPLPHSLASSFHLLNPYSRISPPPTLQSFIFIPASPNSSLSILHVLFTSVPSILLCHPFILSCALLLMSSSFASVLLSGLSYMFFLMYVH